MKAITISQPWADLIARGEKFIENRTWSTDYRGPLAIHAGKGSQYLNRQELERYTTGAIVATCDLVAIVNRLAPTRDQLNELERAGFTWEQVNAHRYADGPFCWVLSEIRAANEPFAITGRQGLWNVPPAALDAAVDDLAY